MLFNVKAVVSRAEYDKHINDLRAAGQTGMLNNTISRGELMDGQDAGTDGGN
jgi:cytochrome c oxidase subunit 2